MNETCFYPRKGAHALPVSNDTEGLCHGLLSQVPTCPLTYTFNLQMGQYRYPYGIHATFTCYFIDWLRVLNALVSAQSKLQGRYVTLRIDFLQMRMSTKCVTETD